MSSNEPGKRKSFPPFEPNPPPREKRGYTLFPTGGKPAPQPSQTLTLTSSRASRHFPTLTGLQYRTRPVLPERRHPPIPRQDAARLPRLQDAQQRLQSRLEPSQRRERAMGTAHGRRQTRRHGDLRRRRMLHPGRPPSHDPADRRRLGIRLPVSERPPASPSLNPTSPH